MFRLHLNISTIQFFIFCTYYFSASQCCHGDCGDNHHFDYFLSLRRISRSNQLLKMTEFTPHLVFIFLMWKHSLPEVISSLFYGLTHLSAVSLNHSVLCLVKFYCTCKMLIDREFWLKNFALKGYRSVGGEKICSNEFRRCFWSFIIHQCFKDHLLKSIFHFKVDYFLRDKLLSKAETARSQVGSRKEMYASWFNRCETSRQEKPHIWNNILANGKGLELFSWWIHFHEIREKRLSYLSGVKWDRKTDLSRQPIS